MAFSDDFMQQTMEEIEKRSSWRADAANLAQYKTVMSKRFRLLCRHASQSLAKKLKWADALKPPSGSSAAASGTSTPAASEEPSATPAPSGEYFFGYSWEQDKAWRMAPNSK
eukprot:10209063-Alexandrium_andersonii.AAC.1